ncbi:MAG: hypothetical protein KGO81_09185 [Bacteroidota bacterium]|nr:hypothetical protein [Bacteroidota bacterium]
MLKLSDTAFNLTKEYDITIRGSYLRFSAHLEGVMTKYIIYLNEIKIKRFKKDDPIDFSNFMFGTKTKKFTELLQLIYIDLYEMNQKLLDKIWEFKEIRNKIAHCYFEWDEADLSYVTIWDLENKKATPQRIIPSKYSIVEIQNKLNNFKIAIIHDFNILASELLKRAQLEIPYLFE